MAYNDPSLLKSQLYLLLFVFGSAALVVAVYHFFLVACFNWLHQASPRHQPGQGGAPGGRENSMVELIPAHKFQKGSGLAGEDGTCAVCLCDYEEGEELRTLPECGHSFHVPCIDMWLYSHSTCPICRADAISSTPTSRCLSDDGLGRSALQQGSGVMLDFGVHSEAV